MKQLQRLTMAAVLVLIIAMSALAGEIPIPGTAPMPTPQSSTLTTTPGNVPIRVTDNEDSATQLLEELALDLLQTLLSVY